MESEAGVVAARGSIFGSRQSEDSFSAPESEESGSIPYQAGEQLDRAVSYICARLEDVIAMLLASAYQLDELVGIVGSDVVARDAETSSVLRLVDGKEFIAETNVAKLIEAEKYMRVLKAAIQDWLEGGAESEIE